VILWYVSTPTAIDVGVTVIADMGLAAVTEVHVSQRLFAESAFARDYWLLFLLAHPCVPFALERAARRLRRASIFLSK
jgi:hypothetical protein